MHKISVLFTMLAAFVLSACQSQPVIDKLVVFDSSANAPLAINARRMEIIDNWLMPLEAPFIEHEIDPNPSQKLIDWATDTLQPRGGSGELILNISEASFQLEALPKAEGFLNSLSDNQESRIRVTIEAQLLWIQPVGNYQGTAQLAAKTTQTLPESATPRDYDIAMQNNINRAIVLIDEQARTKIAEMEGIILP